jgi:hypothetical protein
MTGKWHKFYALNRMREKNYTGLVPENTEGKAITAEASVVFADPAEAKEFYRTARERLLLVNNWGSIAGSLSAGFQLTDEKGKKTDRLVQKGDHFKIDIPGLGSKAGEGYDWVRVEEVKEVNTNEVDSIAIRVRPASNPQNDTGAVAHFYSKGSTSTFVVTREGNTVTASIYDRNIEANKETGEPLDKIRNAVVGTGAKHKLSKLQWQALAEALVERS